MVEKKPKGIHAKNQFHHGGNIYEAARRWAVPLDAITDYSANINPLVTTKWLQEHMKPIIPQILHYPDVHYTKLVEVISAFHGVDLRQVVVGNGATELIHQICSVVKPKRVALVAPTFAEYEKAALKQGSEIHRVYADPETLAVGLDTFFEALKEVDLAFLCNPNNPTGLMVSSTALKEGLMNRKDKAWVVIDEAFIDFTEDGDKISLVNHLSKMNRVLVLRSATKFYGIPGLRLGYLISSEPGMADALKLTLPIWHINVMAAGIVANVLMDGDFRQQTVDYIAYERNELQEALEALGCKVYASTVNYILFYEASTIDWVDALATFHVMIRDCSQFKGLSKGFYRIAVKTRAQNRQLIGWMKKVKEGLHV